MSADQELDRVVAWLRREAGKRLAVSRERYDENNIEGAAVSAMEAGAFHRAADALARHEHRSE